MDTNWTETGFSGNMFLNFQNQTTDGRWNVTINRYGPPVARLWFILGGAGALIAEHPMKWRLTAEQDLGTENMPDDERWQQAREWADQLIASGVAAQRVIFGKEAT